MTFSEKCISVNQAVTDISLRSKSVKNSFDSYNLDSPKCTFCSMLSSKILVFRASASLCQQFSQPCQLTEAELLHFPKDSTQHFWLLLASAWITVIKKTDFSLSKEVNQRFNYVHLFEYTWSSSMCCTSHFTYTCTNTCRNLEL